MEDVTHELGAMVGASRNRQAVMLAVAGIAEHLEISPFVILSRSAELIVSAVMDLEVEPTAAPLAEWPDSEYPPAYCPPVG